MKSIIKNGLMFLAGILMLTTSCDQISESEKTGKGTVVLTLTDAPFPTRLVDKVLISIDKIELRSAVAVNATKDDSKDGMGSSKENDKDDKHGLMDNDEDNPTRYTVLYEGSEKEFDLLGLQNGLTTQLLDMNIAPGAYDLIRMHITKAKVVLKDGNIFDLKIPAGHTGGLKIKIKPALVIESGVESEVILDFDVHKSFIIQGNFKSKDGIKGFILKPVIRAVCRKYSGIIAGKVFENETTLLPDAHVQVISADTILSSALTNKVGNYQMIGLPAGTYKMICEKDGYAIKTIDAVIVKVREKTIQDIQMTK